MEVRELRIENREDPTRPMITTREGEEATIRLGDLGLTDVTIHLTAEQKLQLRDFLA